MRSSRLVLPLVALVLLGEGARGATCVQDAVPGATLLVPYFGVSRNGSAGGNIPPGGTDTLCSLSNTGATGIVVRFNVWNKYGRVVLGFNVPMVAHDSFVFSMRDILNGHLNLNPTTQKLVGLQDPCGLDLGSNTYAPTTGFGAATFIRFANPVPGDPTQDFSRGWYNDPAFAGYLGFYVWDSLDESALLTSFVNINQAGVLDTDNPASGVPSDFVLSGDFSGYLTLDVVNYCTSLSPENSAYYTSDALATAGWSASGFTPNVLQGDYILLEATATSGNESAHPMVALEFDTRLDWQAGKTFYGKHRGAEPTTGTTSPVAYQFRGDGREPLGSSFGVRYMNDVTSGVTSRLIAWRNDDVDLSSWYQNCHYGGACAGFGYADGLHELSGSLYDQDSNTFVGSPSAYLFLNAQRLTFPTMELNPVAFKFGWASLTINGSASSSQAFVDIQHDGATLAPGNRLGHHASLLSEEFTCSPSIFTTPGNTP